MEFRAFVDREGRFRLSVECAKVHKAVYGFRLTQQKKCFRFNAIKSFNDVKQFRWRGGVMGKGFRFAISRSQVQLLLEATLRNNLRQVVYTYVPLSPSSITWYRPKGGDALRLGR